MTRMLVWPFVIVSTAVALTAGLVTVFLIVVTQP